MKTIKKQKAYMTVYIPQLGEDGNMYTVGYDATTFDFGDVFKFKRKCTEYNLEYSVRFREVTEIDSSHIANRFVNSLRSLLGKKELK
jgi:hypothetical protein